jgi:membrane protease YdiL (CAAX protease family)
MIFALYGLYVCVGLLPLLLLASWRARGRRPLIAWFVVFFVLLVLDTSATLLPVEYQLNPSFFHWNWVGKGLSIAWGLLFIAFGPIPARKIGVALPRAGTHRVAWSIVATAIVASAIGDWLSGPLEPSAQTLLYQLTMPALAEELVYRGILLAVLSYAFREEEYPSRYHLGWSVWITATAFALAHGLQMSHGLIHLQLLSCLFPFAFAVLAGWLRRYTGSLLLPIALHSGIDFAAAGVGLF